MAIFNGPRGRRMVVAMKEEVTYGTDVFGGTYTAADIVPSFNIQPAAGLEEIPNLSMAGDLGRLISAIGKESAAVSFEMFFKGAGAAYSASVFPSIHHPMIASGHLATLTATMGAEKWTYTPAVPSQMKAYTIYVAQEFGVALKMTGAVGNVTFSVRAGGVVVARFSFAGILEGMSDVAFVEGADGGAAQYPVAKSAAFQIGTENYAARIANASFDAGMMVQPADDMNAAGALAGVYILDRVPRLSIDPQMDTLANYAWFTKWKDSTLADCTFQIGQTAYNRLKLSFPKLQIVGQGYGNRDGLTILPTTLLATLQSGNDDYTVTAD